MNVRDMLNIKDLSVDVCDDYDERSYIGFEHGFHVTPDGAERFADALELEATLFYNKQGDPYGATIHCDNGKEASACRDLFYSIAGFCADSDFNKWFKEV